MPINQTSTFDRKRQIAKSGVPRAIALSFSLLLKELRTQWTRVMRREITLCGQRRDRAGAESLSYCEGRKETRKKGRARLQSGNTRRSGTESNMNDLAACEEEREKAQTSG
jgi:hypothetical protein